MTAPHEPSGLAPRGHGGNGASPAGPAPEIDAAFDRSIAPETGATPPDAEPWPPLPPSPVPLSSPAAPPPPDGPAPLPLSDAVGRETANTAAPGTVSPPNADGMPPSVDSNPAPVDGGAAADSLPDCTDQPPLPAAPPVADGDRSPTIENGARSIAESVRLAPLGSPFEPAAPPVNGVSPESVPAPVVVEPASLPHRSWRQGLWRVGRTVFLEGAVIAVFALVAVLFYRDLLFTTDVAAEPRLLREVYPARDFLGAALREGRLALWNPYLFTGVPFLADPEMGALYPLNIALRWLDAPRALVLSLVAHSVLAAVGTAAFVRYAFGTGRPAGVAAGLSFGFGGFLAGHAIAPNVVEAVAWLPWVLLWLDIGCRRALVAGLTGSAVCLALQLLAGDPQASMFTAVAAALWLLVRAVTLSLDWWRAGRRGPVAALRLLRPPALALTAPLAAAGLAAAQLMPAWELFRRSARVEPLSIDQVAGGALGLDQAIRALLPGFTDLPEQRLIAYSSIIALGLAAVTLRRPSTAALFALALGGFGVLVALGDATPALDAFHGALPAWALFDQPARAVLLVSFAIAVAAGAGLEALDRARPPAWAGGVRLRRAWLGGMAAAVALLGVAVVAGRQRLDLPSTGIRQIWLGLAIVAVDVAIVLPLVSPRRWIAQLLLLLVAAELVVAGARLPFTARAPAAVYEVRPALAATLADDQRPPRLGWMPGYRGSVAAAQPGFEQYTAARQGRDQLAPNAALHDRIATLEGFPTALTPPRAVYEALAGQPGFGPINQGPVGGLTDAAAGALGPRLGVDYLFGPPRRTIQAGTSEFILGIDLTIAAGAEAVIAFPRRRITTGVSLLTDFANAPAAGQPAVELVMLEEGGAERRRMLVSGADTADVTTLAPARAIALGDGAAAVLTEQPFGRPASFRSLTLRNLSAAGTLYVRGLTLFDERTGGSMPLLLNETFIPIAGADPAVYLDSRTPPRAAFSRDYVVRADSAATRRDLATTPAGTVVLDRAPDMGVSAEPAGVPPGIEQVRVTHYAPERVDVSVAVTAAGVLVLRDLHYPGWQARLDGKPVEILEADGLFRAVAVPAGIHSVVFEFHSRSLRTGGIVSLAVAGALLLLLALSLTPPPWRRRPVAAGEDSRAV